MATQVGIADRVFLLQESGDIPQHVAALGTFTLPPAAPPDYVQRLVESFRAARTFAPPFNYRLRSAALKAIAPAFVELPDEEVDLDYHFRHSALPKPGGERELGILVSRLHSRALWTIGPSRRPRDAPDGASPAGMVRSAAGGLRRQLSTSAGLSRVAAGLIREGIHASDEALATPYKVPDSILNGRVSQQRRVATQAIASDRARDVADRADVTINDVFLALCSAGLRRYLLELDALPEHGPVAGTPVSVRVGDGDSANNAFTMTTMKMYTDIAYPVTLLYHGMALFIASLGVSGKMGLGFTGDRDRLPHLQRLAVYTGEALDELESALAGTPARRRRTASKPKA